MKFLVFMIILATLAGAYINQYGLELPGDVFGYVYEWSQSAAKTSKNVKQSLKQYERYDGNTVNAPSWSPDDDDMVYVDPGGRFPDFYIDRYEAVVSKGRAWSVPGQNPTTKLTPQDAASACRAAGKRLCQTWEWRIACRDGRTQPHYFQNTNQLLRNCDFGRSKGYDQNDFAGKTDSHPRCATPRLGLHHMIGNVAEMTRGTNNKTVIVGMTYLGTEYYGAAFKGRPHQAMQMACEYTVMDDYPATRRNEGMGFRCCSSAN